MPLRVAEPESNQNAGSAAHPALTYGWDEDIAIGFFGEQLVGNGEYALVWADEARDAQTSQIRFTRYVRQR